MCGIVGYVKKELSTTEGQAPTVEQVLLGGLKRLEYRGYDSAGIAVNTAPGQVVVAKKAGKLQALVDHIGAHPLVADPYSVTAGIGHTRWATHGAPTDENAHPHLADDDKLAVVHNGIIENFAELKARQEAAGVAFRSSTDSEVAAHQLAAHYRECADLTEAMRRTIGELEGAFTLLAIHQNQPGTVVAARRNSPLVVGVGQGENFLGSDVAAFIDYTRTAIEIDQDHIVTLTGSSIEVTNADGDTVQPQSYTVNWDTAAAEKGGYPSFMAKEIHDQPQAVADTLLGRHDASGQLILDEMHLSDEQLRTINRIIVIACGTAAYAGQVASYAVERWCRIPVEVQLAHEFRYREPVVDANTLVVAISQSGETMDTIMAVRYAREQGAAVVAICNTYGSTIPRESDGVLYTHAGPEIAVASTKAFLAQITACYLLGLYLAQLRGTLSSAEITDQLNQLQAIPAGLQQLLGDGGAAHQASELAHRHGDTQAVIFLGRHINFPVALEGALKLKELAYIHAEGFAAGELKHGPIALIEPGQLVVVLMPEPDDAEGLHAKVISNVQEVKARGAHTIVVAQDGDETAANYADELISIPAASTLFSPLLSVVPLQVLAMELATAKGLDVDQPRNLAKSVTVE